VLLESGFRRERQLGERKVLGIFKWGLAYQLLLVKLLEALLREICL
jgi:hypothetical protein